MKIAHVLRSLLAGSVVYVVMAACASSGRDGPPSAGGSASSGGTSGGLVDALIDPVREASAAPESSTEPCNKSFANGASTIYYAEHAYPGATVAELAGVVALVSAGSISPPGTTHSAVTVQLRDGAVVLTCAKSSDTVTFIRP